MRMRIVSATAVTMVALGLVGITMAQPSGEQSRDQGDRVALRGQVARLRAEVELLQTEHDVDRDLLKKLMTDVKNMEGLASLKASAEPQLKSMPGQSPPEVLQGMPFGEAIAKRLQEDAKAEDALMDVTARLSRTLLDRLKKEFVKKAAELDEKRLELAEVEKAYNRAR